MITVLTFKGKLLSNTLIHGFDKANSGDRITLLEFRPETFIGQMHYWFRALHNNLSPKELLAEEAEIFGNTDKRGVFDLSCELDNKDENTNSHLINLVDHNTFTLTLAINDTASIERMKALILISSFLGGVGNRSRRGFGAYQFERCEKKNISFWGSKEENEPIQKPDTVANFWEIIKTLIRQVNSEFKFDDIKSKRNNNLNTISHPFIRKIDIGTHGFSKANKLVIAIKKVTTTIHGKNITFDQNNKIINDDYYFALGGIPIPREIDGFRFGQDYKKARLASPVVVTIVEINNCFHPVIVELNNAHKPKEKEENKEIIEKFKNGTYQEVRNDFITKILALTPKK